MAGKDPWELVSVGKHVEAARAFELAGRVPEAIQAYRRAQRWDEAARLLAQEQHFEDAADCLLQALPKRATAVAELSLPQKRAAANAALFYARAGKLRLATGPLMNLGENERAAELLRRAGRQEDAVRAMRGQIVPGGPWEPGMLSSNLYGREDDPTTASDVFDPFTKAEVYLRKEKPEEALEALLTIPYDHGRYPEAVTRVVRLVKQHDLMSLKVDQFVAPFVKDKWGHGHTPAHTGTLYTLARVYEKLGFEDMAEAAYDAVLKIDDSYRDARARRDGMLRPNSLTEDELELILGDDQAFHEVGRHRRPGRSTTAEHETPLQAEISTTVSRHGNKTPKERNELQAAVDSKSLELGLGPLGPGSVIKERWRIEGALGEGGYAVVYAVTDLAMGEPAALKMFVRGGDDPQALARFKQEMRITRKLAHPNLIQVYEFGVWRDAYFITMELLEGMDLHDLMLFEGGQLSLEMALDLTDQAFAGLAEAHRQGVVHRDIKPRNLFITEGGRLKVTDFGIAKMGDTIDGHTATGQVVGTPAYIPPERLRSDDPDLEPPVDLYAVGVCLYRMLAGRLPFQARHIETLFMKVLEEVPLPLSTWNEAVPPELDAMVACLLEKDPADRYETADEAREAIAWVREVLDL